MSDTRVADACAASAGILCAMATWAIQTLPIIEWLSYFAAFIAGIISIYKHIRNKFKTKGRNTDG